MVTLIAIYDFEGCQGRCDSRLVRVYVEARLDPLPDPAAGDSGPSLDPDRRGGKRGACVKGDAG